MTSFQNKWLLLRCLCSRQDVTWSLDLMLSPDLLLRTQPLLLVYSYSITDGARILSWFSTSAFTGNQITWFHLHTETDNIMQWESLRRNITSDFTCEQIIRVIEDAHVKRRAKRSRLRALNNHRNKRRNATHIWDWVGYQHAHLNNLYSKRHICA